jgi:hypothetical protein
MIKKAARKMACSMSLPWDDCFCLEPDDAMRELAILPS